MSIWYTRQEGELDSVPGMFRLTVGLDADVHLSVGGVRDSVTAELDSRAGDMLAAAHNGLALKFLLFHGIASGV